MPTKRDLQHATGWWLRHMGYLSTTDERKVESLAEVFDEARRAAMLEMLEEAIDLVRTCEQPELALERIASLMRQKSEPPGEFKTAAEADRMLVELEKAMPFCVASGPNSTALHAKRIAEVRAERDRLAEAEKSRTSLEGKDLAHYGGRWHSQQAPPAPPDDGLVCACLLDKRCPIHGDEA